MGERASVSDLLKPENVQVIDRTQSWEDAIRVSLKPLIEGGYAEPRYAENVIKDTKELGPYYVLTEDVALIHARPEEGAIKKQMAVTLVHEPVIFEGSMFSVRLLFSLSAEDSDSHIEVIKLLAHICEDPSKVERLTTASSPDELYNMILSNADENHGA